MSYKVGSKVTIWITGMVGNYEAEIVSFDAEGKPRLKVTNAKNFPTLYDGDYIIREGHYGASSTGSSGTSEER
jgi:hypothetical protein